MSVRLAAKISYLGDRLAGRAGCTVRPRAPGRDPRAACRLAGRTAHADGQAAGGGCPWVLPGVQPYTGAEGAEGANLLDFFNPFSCSFGFGSKAWADAR